MAALEFNEPPKSTEITDLPSTDYARNREEWDQRIGTQTVAKKNWQMAAFGLLLLCLVQAAGVIYLQTKSIVVPYLLLIDSQSGAPIETRKIDGAMQIGEREIQYFLADLVRKTRVVPKDPVIYEQNWTAAYSFLTKEASQKMNAVITKEKQVDRLKEGSTSQVQINSFSQLAKNTYQIRWTESNYDASGKPLEDYKMVGTFEIKTKTPQDEKTILSNPLGIYVLNFSWSREF